MGAPPPPRPPRRSIASALFITTEQSGSPKQNSRPTTSGAKRSFTFRCRSHEMRLAGPSSNFPMMDWNESSIFQLVLEGGVSTGRSKKI